MQSMSKFVVRKLCEACDEVENSTVTPRHAFKYGDKVRVKASGRRYTVDIDQYQPKDKPDHVALSYPTRNGMSQTDHYHHSEIEHTKDYEKRKKANTGVQTKLPI